MARIVELFYLTNVFSLHEKTLIKIKSSFCIGQCIGLSAKVLNMSNCENVIFVYRIILKDHLSGNINF